MMTETENSSSSSNLNFFYRIIFEANLFQLEEAPNSGHHRVLSLNAWKKKKNIYTADI